MCFCFPDNTLHIPVIVNYLKLVCKRDIGQFLRFWFSSSQWMLSHCLLCIAAVLAVTVVVSTLLSSPLSNIYSLLNFGCRCPRIRHVLWKYLGAPAMFLSCKVSHSAFLTSLLTSMPTTISLCLWCGGSFHLYSPSRWAACYLLLSYFHFCCWHGGSRYPSQPTFQHTQLLGQLSQRFETPVFGSWLLCLAQ